ncbi:MAG TPA: hypothetical protein VFP59_03775 [Candidatus Angelobacter sp.]|nr:hypothetical protein [Candidatus Angelobacter sp.]
MFKALISFACLVLAIASPLQAQQAEVSQAARKFSGAISAPAPKHTIKVPRRAGLKFLTLVPLSSATAKAGDQVPLRLDQPLIINNQTVLPAGTVVKATVTQVKPADKCHDGEVHWKLDRVPFPDSSTAKTKIWSTAPGPTLEVPERLFREDVEDDVTFTSWPAINEWWEAPFAAPMYTVLIAFSSFLLVLRVIGLPFSSSCEVPGKEYELPVGSSVAVMVTEAHTLSY